MRVIAEIPHPQIKITIFSWNAKYIIKLEAGPYEQTFKIAESDIAGLEQVQALLTPEFIDACIQRFIAMRSDFSTSFKSLNV
ncbi:MAG: hypothetical protein ACK40M_06850 [Flavobacteriales bacterium]|mgnify:CR=1 FL=1|nr:hypothetical protein [Flavobacteriales bacterium]HCA83383.1 hypothetical protein [Flavobacteriales bacterium]HRE74054.1 hypothetical protein [Flavobacteriales bacterium]HRE95917.1 hypothetical protein [Flavobacteriales bacterium]HRJ34428.1 hypothetical protein [Flavobacteriales bacterium]